MKNLIAFLVMLLLGTTKTMNAQAYRPMVVDSVRWIVVFDLFDTPWSDDIRWEYFAHGDTLVNGMEYKKIYQRFLETPHSSGPPFNPISNYQLAALMREDTITRQVFGIPLQVNIMQTECPEGQESLLYDFSLVVGDTANHFCVIPNVSSCGEVHITATGNSIEYGINTKFFQVSGGCTYGQYYEGIGSEFGLFEAMFTPVKSSNLWRVYLEFYCPTSDCPFIVNTAEILANSEIVVYPNPISTQLQIENLSDGVYEVSFYNTLGLKTNSLQAESISNMLLLSGLNMQPGVYLLEIKNQKGRIGTKKVIIQ